MGTLGNGFGGKLAAAENTTPDATTLQRSLAKFKQQGAYSVVMEVSSHGIVQGRINGTMFPVAVLAICRVITWIITRIWMLMQPPKRVYFFGRG